MSDEKIRAFLKEHGPSTPTQLCKHLNTSLLFASAMLGQVASQGDVKISKLKIGGGSPLYYLKNDSPKLQEFAKHLPPREYNAYEQLKEKKVLKDAQLEPVTRVALRNVRDFAEPISIIRGEQKELFWKWYLLSDDEAKEGIRNILAKEEGENKIDQKNSSEQQSISKESSKDMQPIETTEKIQAPEKKETVPAIQEKTSQKEQPVKTSENNSQVEKKAHSEQEQAKVQAEQKTITKPSALPAFEKNEKHSDLLPSLKEKYTYPFAKRIFDYFISKEITIISAVQHKKTELSFVIKVPSAVGSSRTYAKAIDKKRINEGDLALALVEGQHKHISTIILTTGKLSKRAEELQDTLFEDITVEKI